MKAITKTLSSIAHWKLNCESLPLHCFSNMFALMEVLFLEKGIAKLN